MTPQARKTKLRYTLPTGENVRYPTLAGETGGGKIQTTKNFSEKYCNFVKNTKMSTLELKNILIKKISEINDNSFLEAIMTIIDSKIDSKIYPLTAQQKDAIIESKKQVANGDVFSNDQINQEFKEWLKKA